MTDSDEVLVKIGVGYSSEIPLCVDLDGTLIQSDSLYEALAILAKQSIVKFLLVPFILLRGRAYLKSWLASHVRLDVEHLPYNPAVIELIKKERAKGRKIVLATASNIFYAQSIADHLDIFDAVIASDEETNLKGRRKRDLLDENYGRGRYGYIGDSAADLIIWRESQEVFVVSNTDSFLDKVRAVSRVEPVLIPSLSPSLAVLLKELRVHQWVKNLLIFVPILLAHKVFDSEALSKVILSFFSFSLCASSVYVVNDLLDLSSDRRHARKKFRPFASGALPISYGLVLIPILFFSAFLLAFSININFTEALVVYFATTLAYSLVVKQIIVLDIVVLAALYTVRILAGGYAAEVTVSQWLLAFSMFFFLSLACVKRFSELFALRLSNGDSSHGRGYKSADLEQIGSLGSAAGYISVLVLTLFINSNEVRFLYSNPEILWLIAPLLLYWISRVWLLAHRGDMHEDPIVFALRDSISYVVGLVTIIIVVFSA